jgi:hypothetical protein
MQTRHFKSLYLKAQDHEPKHSSGKHIVLIMLFLLSFVSVQLRAAVFTVTNTLDDGSTGSLRWAVNQVNLSTDATNEIRFQAGLGEIVVGSNLPALVKQVHINGYANDNTQMTEIRFRTYLPVRIRLAAGSAAVNALFTLATGSSNSQFSGIDFHIIGGVATAAAIYKSPATTVRDVHVWGNSFNYDYATNSPYTGSQGFFLGVYGLVASDKTSNTTGWYIGGKTPGFQYREGNLIANSLSTVNAESIRIFSAGSFVIASNFFGFQRNGTTPLYGSAQSSHILLTNCNSFLIGADNNDNINFKRNLFTDGNGVRFIGNAATGTFTTTGLTTYYWDGNNAVKGNYFGVDRTGTPLSTASAVNPIYIHGSNKNIIGGPNVWERNIIAAATSTALSAGIRIVPLNGVQTASTLDFTPSNENIIQNNYIGTGSNGTTAGPNAIGIRFSSAAITAGSAEDIASSNTVIGNRIAYNTQAGIVIDKANSDGYIRFNTFTQNAIYQNGGPGIDLQSFGLATQTSGVDGNDGALSTSTAATQQHIDNPVINSVIINSPTSATITGYIGNLPAGNTAFGGANVEIFLADITPSPDNGAVHFGDGLSVAHGEGATYLGSTTADANGLFTITVSGTGFTTSTLFTGTATLSGSTSEFGPTTSLLALPVTFGDVQAQIKDGKLWVNWTTLSETNNSLFEIEASADGKNFTKIGELKSKAIDGNSEETLSYEFTATAPAAVALALGLLGLAAIGCKGRSRKTLLGLALIVGVSGVIAGCQKEAGKEITGNDTLFIRIAQVDKDGTKKYSPIVKATQP